jgi:hypothetical protein
MIKDDVLLVLDVISFVRKPLRKNSKYCYIVRFSAKAAVLKCCEVTEWCMCLCSIGFYLTGIMLPVSVLNG